MYFEEIYNFYFKYFSKFLVFHEIIAKTSIFKTINVSLHRAERRFCQRKKLVRTMSLIVREVMSVLVRSEIESKLKV